MSTRFSILVVDDDEIARAMLMEALRRDQYRVTGAESAERALEILPDHPVDLVITDVQMGGLSGIELVKIITERYPGILTVVVTAFSNSEVTIEAIRAGAFDFISKPFQLDKIRQIVANALEKRSLIHDSIEIVPVKTLLNFTTRLVGQSEKMIAVFKLIGRVANTESTILLSGESGTGKEIVARAIHENSYRRDKPFLAINCGALPETLLESELFGYEKGAFTGADKTHIGIFEAISGGTCLLDEIGEMPFSMQAKLLRVLQDREIRRVGSTREIRVDVRVISSTNRNLEEMVGQRKFREDLFYRLNVVPIHLPPLRDRKEDIPALVEYFLNQYMQRNKKPGIRVAKESMRLLTAFDWPGNVRELQNVVESAATVTPTGVITPDLLPVKVRSNEQKDLYLEKMVPESSGRELLPLATIERIYILRVLKELNNNKSMAARVLGLDRKTLRLKLKQYGYESDGEDVE